jgi:hypothetical protein
MKVSVVIPFRDRGIDLRRAANLEVVQAWWYAHGFEPQIVEDGHEGEVQFNRHRAYNRAVSGNPGADVFVFTEADMLIHPDQVHTAIERALVKPGLVVPFTQYRYLSDAKSRFIRDSFHDMSSEDLAEWWSRPPHNETGIFTMEPEHIMDDGDSIGAVNVVSRATLDITGGFTEATSGNWYDDNIIEEGFAFLTGQRTRWVPGPAVHLYHLPGHKGEHLTVEDRRATQRNKMLLTQMRLDIRRNDRLAVKTLMATRDLTAPRERAES